MNIKQLSEVLSEILNKYPELATKEVIFQDGKSLHALVQYKSDSENISIADERVFYDLDEKRHIVTDVENIEKVFLYYFHKENDCSNSHRQRKNERCGEKDAIF